MKKKARNRYETGTIQTKLSLAERPSWDRKPFESAKAFAAFCAFRDLGSDRSVVGAYREIKGRPAAAQPSGQWKAWASDHQWEERAAAYDAHMAQVEARAREQEIAKRATEIERRRKQAQDESWALYEELKGKVQQMLKLPIVTVTDVDGKKVINPAKWDYSSLTRAIEAMISLMKLGAGLDSGFMTTLNIDWESLTEEELQRVAAGEELTQVMTSVWRRKEKRAG